MLAHHHGVEGQKLFDLFEERRLIRERQASELVSMNQFADEMKVQSKRAHYQKKALTFAARSYSQLNVTKAAYNDLLAKYAKRYQYYEATHQDTQLILNITKVVHRYELLNITNRIYEEEANINITTPIDPNYFEKLNGTTFTTLSTTYFSRGPFSERARLVTGEGFGIFMTGHGTLYSFGTKSYALGRTKKDRSVLPVDFKLPENEEIWQIVAGDSHVLLLTNLKLYAWGSNTWGQLGDGTTTTRQLPMEILTHSESIVFIAAGTENSFYINTAGELFAWGRNNEYQLGLGTDRTIAPSSIKLPTLVSFAGSPAVTHVCAGLTHVVVRFINGSFSYWGKDFPIAGPYYSPVYQYFARPVDLGVSPNDYPTKNHLDFVCGDRSTLFLTSLGTVFGFGEGANGRLGITGSASKSVLTQITTTNLGTSRKIVKLFHKKQSAFAVCDDGTVWAWGSNYHCQLGTGRYDYYRWWSGYWCYDVPIPRLITAFPKAKNPYYYEFALMSSSSAMIYADGNKLYYAGAGKSEDNRLGARIVPRYAFKNIQQVKMQFWSPLQRNYPFFTTVDNQTVYFREDHYMGTSKNNLNIVSVLGVGVTSQTAPNQGITTMGRDEKRKMFAYSFFNTHILTINTTVFFFGGMINHTMSNKIYSTDSVYGAWTLHNRTLPYPVASGMYALVEDYFYIFGGMTTDNIGNLIPLNKIIRAPLRDILSWEVTKMTLPSPIYAGHTEIIGDYIYIFGGRRFDQEPNADILRSPLVNMTWSNTYMILPYPIVDGPVLYDSKNIYMFGGYYATNEKYYPNIVKAKLDNPMYWEDSMTKIPSVGSRYYSIGCGSVFLLGMQMNRTDTTVNVLSTNSNQFCSSHGNCVRGSCLCHSQWTGLNCSIPICFGIPQWEPGVCSGRGACVGPDTCNCTQASLWGGPNCNIHKCDGVLSTNALSVCNNGNGTCISPNTCDCNAGYRGTRCEIAICYGVSGDDYSVCSGNGACVKPDTCICGAGYVGSNCETYFMPTIRIKATIDGSDTIIIKGGVLTWQHGAYGAPTAITIDGVAFTYTSSKNLGFNTDGISRVSVTKTAPTNRAGTVSITQMPTAQNGWQTKVYVDDTAGGAGAYDFTITING
ncbi:hypothetical protein C9374_001568 [Naegleria lovaniensis]|uniref:EGF-like domain-containing protein n=1 Tax=Naegleria lovaniensis TaxID=51637 RepID=A0AA88KN62_NAELO|nr:uncharacterized protein C9374_001568 [Naegleria lovaniensis]KAG2387236.1 hypothetical protein C9374_001568 [Naegleria lovaniensis]